MMPRLDVRLPRRGGGRNGGPTLFALAVHVVVLFIVARTISVPVLDFLSRVGDRPVQERITYVTPPRDAELAPAPSPPAVTQPAEGPVSGGVERPSLPPMPVFPPVGDSGGGQRPPPAAGAAAGTGRQAFGSGVPGLSTGPVDPRLVLPPGIPDAPVRNQIRTPDQYVEAWVAAFWDSVAKEQLNRGRRPGDWTAQRADGSKYGMDQQFIYFGKYKLPTVLLAMLPINAQANPSAADRHRALESMRFEINYHAQRAHNEADFRKAVNELRARRERERQEQQQQTPPPGRGGIVPPEP